MNIVVFEDRFISLELKKLLPQAEYTSPRPITGKDTIIVNLWSDFGGVGYVSTHKHDVLTNNMEHGLWLYRQVQQWPDITVINVFHNCIYPPDVKIQQEHNIFTGEPDPSVEAYAYQQRMLYALSRTSRAKTINLLIPNHYGKTKETDPTKVHGINGLLLRMLERPETFEMWGDGSVKRSWIPSWDVAEAIVTAIDNREDLPSAHPILVGDGSVTTMHKVFDALCELLDYTPTSIIYNMDKPQGVPVKHFRPYNPLPIVYTPLYDGLKRLVKEMT